MLWWTLRQLHARAPHTRASAAELLGYSRDQRAVLPLMATLQDDHAAVRKAAAGALVQQGDRRAVNSLVAALQDDPLASPIAGRALHGGEHRPGDAQAPCRGGGVHPFQLGHVAGVAVAPPAPTAHRLAIEVGDEEVTVGRRELGHLNRRVVPAPAVPDAKVRQRRPDERLRHLGVHAQCPDLDLAHPGRLRRGRDRPDTG